MAVTREFEIIYGAYTVPNLDGQYKFEEDRERGVLTFSFVIQSDTEAGFITACQAAEAAFKKPYQDLTVTMSAGNALLTAKQSDGTALDPMPELSKEEHKANTGRSRRYIARVEYGLPATTGAEPSTGLRESTVDVAYTVERRRRVTFSGTYTANGATGARATYEAGIDSYANGILTGLGIAAANREIIDEPSVRTDTNDKICDFQRVYAELIFSQGGSSTNDTSLVGQRLSISRRQEGPGDTITSERLATLDVSYETGVDKDVSTDLRGKYASIRDWILTQVTTTLNGGSFAVVMEEPIYDYDVNRISARWTVLGQPTGETVLENRITTDDDDQVGVEFLPIWGGRNTDAYTWSGPRVIIRSVTHTQKRVGTFNEGDAQKFMGGEAGKARGRQPYDAARGGIWKIIARRPSATPLRLGIGQDTMDITELLTTRMRYVTSASATSGGGDGPVITPGG
jgi:hypothetical protein